MSSTEKNIRALECAAQQDRARLDGVQAELRGAQATIAGLVAELASLRVQVIVLLAQRGTGGTV
jgi:acetyl-CoA carboxylase alpha subunit